MTLDQINRRSALEMLSSEFRSAGKELGSLFHQRFSVPNNDALPDTSSKVKSMWEDFAVANRSTFDSRNHCWHKWIPHPTDSSCSRFFGHGGQEAFDHFQRLARTGMKLLEALWLDPHEKWQIDANVLDQIEAVHGDHSYLNWVEVLHLTARQSRTLFLDVTLGNWHYNRTSGESIEQIASQMSEPSAFGLVAFPIHPIVEALQHDVFRSSVDAINVWLGDQQAIRLPGDDIQRPPIQLPAISPQADQDQLAEIASGEQRPSSVQFTPSPKMTCHPSIEFCREGATWHLEFAQEKAPFTSDLFGFELYRVLLCEIPAGHHIGVLDLEGKANIGRPLVEEGGQQRADFVMDSVGNDELAHEIKKLKDAIDDEVNEDKIHDLNQRLLELLGYEQSAKGWKGKPRTTGYQSELNKATQRVNKNLKKARELIGESMPEFAKYLAATVERVGTTILYDPSRFPLIR